ncbi:MAG TPA: hypothetical protein VGR69_04655 [Candidatus Rubrimentiphilum sp.]|nr:hypothetical protein [Candidatus Rubrimentiphilum sp.]
MAIAGYWAVAGLYTDAGWHIRHDVDTFFTWAHAVLYSGLLLLLGILIGMYIVACRNGQRDLRSIFGAAYGWSAIGALVFLAGGIADMVNHLFFGFEGGFDALLAPTHQLIGAGVLLIIAGPIRSALLQTPRPATLRDQLPAIIAAAAIMELIHWGTQVFFRVDAAKSLGIAVPHQLTSDAITLSTVHFFQQGGSLIAIILQSLLMMGTTLYLVRNFRLRSGALTTLFLLGNGLIAITHAISVLETAAVLIASLVAGIVADLLSTRGPITASRLRYEAFAFVVPMIYTGTLLFFTIAFMGGIWWDPIFAAGAVFYSGLFALLLSFVAYPEPWTSASP